jgi:hypothetical protein
MLRLRAGFCDYAIATANNLVAVTTQFCREVRIKRIICVIATSVTQDSRQHVQPELHPVHMWADLEWDKQYSGKVWVVVREDLEPLSRA